MQPHLNTLHLYKNQRVMLVRSELCIVLLLASAGCGMLRKVERERSETAAAELHSIYKDSLNMQHRQTASHFQLQHSDSNVADYVLEIWPKGAFSIRKGEGFIGAAEKVQIRGRNLSVLKNMLTGDSTRSETRLEQQRHAAQEIKSSSASQLFVRKQPAWKWALILLAVGIGLDLAYDLYKKRRRLTAEPPSL